jgi:hypothetical protein
MRRFPVTADTDLINTSTTIAAAAFTFASFAVLAAGIVGTGRMVSASILCVAVAAAGDLQGCMTFVL